RALQGLGGGGLISLAQTIIADIVSPKQRPRYQAYIAGVFAISSIAGPVLGAIIMAAATVTLLLALNWGGVRYAWTSPLILSLFAGSTLLWALFILRLKTASEPLIPAEVLANPVVAKGTIAACFGMGVFIGLTIY